jgi:hypothetical protein
MSGYASFLSLVEVQINLAELQHVTWRGWTHVGRQQLRASVPAGRDEATGLPIGVLITGRRFREDACLEAAGAIEARLGLARPIDPAQ